MKNNALVVGQIGCGAFAIEQDLPNFEANPRTTVRWACDSSPGRAKAAAERFRIPKTTGDYGEVLADPEVHMIKISTSHEVHLQIILDAAAAGKHVFCEKPLALEEEDALRIVEAVRRNGVKLCVDLNRRMAPAMQAMKRRWIEHRSNPKHQPWRYIEVKREPFPEEQQTHLLIRVQDESATYRLVHLDPLHGGGLVVGESVHWMDLACWFFAPVAPVEIRAWGSRRLSHGIVLTFPGGDTATVIFSCSGTFDYPKELYEVTSTAALLRSLYFVENNYYGIPDLDAETFPLQRDDISGIDAEPGFAGYMKKYEHYVRKLGRNIKGEWGMLSVDRGHTAMLDAFVDAILSGKPSPCDEAAGYTSMCLANLAVKSIELGQTLHVPQDIFSLCLGNY